MCTYLSEEAQLFGVALISSGIGFWSASLLRLGLLLLLLIRLVDRGGWPLSGRWAGWAPSLRGIGPLLSPLAVRRTLRWGQAVDVGRVPCVLPREVTYNQAHIALI